VDFHEDAWSVRLNDKRFGPYSSQEAAITAAMGAAHKAEAQGYEAEVRIEDAGDGTAESGERNAA
jgi:hypothetical protein